MAIERASDLAIKTRQALRRLAGTVVVITTRHDGVRYAMAATAVNALSMDPPSLLICVNKSASIHAPLSKGEYFAINILDFHHQEISRCCSGQVKGEARFEHGDWDDTGVVPVLRDAQATIVLKIDKRIEYGSHTIFIGQVQDARASDGKIDPLIYVDGKYISVETATV